MTLIDTRDRSLFELSILPASTVQNNLASAERFRAFLEGRRQAEARSTFYLNSPVRDYADHNKWHTSFVNDLVTIEGITIPDRFVVQTLSVTRELDGDSLELCKDTNHGTFVARQLIFLDTLPTHESAKSLPPGTMYVDYFAGYIDNHSELMATMVSMERFAGSNPAVEA